MTKVRASVVCEKSLYKIATKHNFGKFLYLGRSEISNNGNKNEAILADSVEAIIAAIFLDGGLEPAKEFIISNLAEEIKIASQNVGLKDYKTVLQEKLQHKLLRKLWSRYDIGGKDERKSIYSDRNR